MDQKEQKLGSFSFLNFENLNFQKVQKDSKRSQKEVKRNIEHPVAHTSLFGLEKICTGHYFKAL